MTKIWHTKLTFKFPVLQRHRRSPHIWYHLLPAVTSALLIGHIITSPATLVSAQCFGGVETYEKTSGTTVVCAENECTSRGLLTQPDTSVTRDCIAICKQSSNCNSFTVGKSIFKSFSNALSILHFQQVNFIMIGV